MAEIFAHSRNEKSFSINLTPIIDVVFLLIVFFVVVFQFIKESPGGVELPENCNFADKMEVEGSVNYILSVGGGAEGGLCITVEEEVLEGQAELIAGEVAGLINKKLGDGDIKSVLTVRIDKNVPYSQAQYILKAISESNAENVQLAVLGESAD